MAKLTTHVLDTYNGIPAENVTIELWGIGQDGTQTLLTTTHTGVDGRTAEPLLEGAGLHIGEYQLIFYMRDYFQAKIGTINASPFLNVIPIRFSIYNPIDNYHVPLAASPWAYSTYRGS